MKQLRLGFEVVSRRKCDTNKELDFPHIVVRDLEINIRSAERNGGFTMRAVVLREYGGPDKLKFEDNVPEPQISGCTGMRQKEAPLSSPAILGRDVRGVVRAVAQM